MRHRTSLHGAAYASLGLLGGSALPVRLIGGTLNGVDSSQSRILTWIGRLKPTTSGGGRLTTVPGCTTGGKITGWLYLSELQIAATSAHRAVRANALEVPRPSHWHLIASCSRWAVMGGLCARHRHSSGPLPFGFVCREGLEGSFGGGFQQCGSSSLRACGSEFRCSIKAILVTRKSNPMKKFGLIREDL
jgi:hypothetical protein